MMLSGSYHTGFAPRDGYPVYPELWRGCVGAWAPCLGPTGLTLRDWSGRQNHGTLTNMVPGDDWVVNRARYALDLDGTNDVIPISGSEVYIRSGIPFTVSCYAFVRSFTNVYAKLMMLRSDCAGNNAWEIGVSNETGFGGYDGILIGTASSYSRVRTGTAAATITNGWHHYCVVYSGADRSLASSFAIYFDGFLQSNLSTGAFSSTTNTSSISLNTLNNRLDGFFDDARIYNRALNVSEIRTLATRRGIAYEMYRPTNYTPPISARRRKILTGQV